MDQILKKLKNKENLLNFDKLKNDHIQNSTEQINTIEVKNESENQLENSFKYRKSLTDVMKVKLS